MSYEVQCETCARWLHRDEAHDFSDANGRLHYWCATCCPVCETLNDSDANGCEIV